VRVKNVHASTSQQPPRFPHDPDKGERALRKDVNVDAPVGSQFVDERAFVEANRSDLTITARS
jgi:hypothetical protein